MDIKPLRKFNELLIKVIFLCFCNDLKFHILSRDGKMLGLSLGIKISISSKSGHSTFVLSTIDIIVRFCHLATMHNVSNRQKLADWLDCRLTVHLQINQHCCETIFLRTTNLTDSHNKLNNTDRPTERGEGEVAGASAPGPGGPKGAPLKKI